MDTNTKRRVAQDLKRFDAMISRLGPLPRIQDYEKITDVRQKIIMELVVQSHMLLRKVVDELIESDDHYYDVRTEQEINSLWREILTLRDIVPKAIIGESVVSAHKNRDDYIDKPDFIATVKRLNSTLSPPPNTLKGWVSLKELAPFKKKYPGRDTLRSWINEALPGMLKSGRPKKTTVI